MSGLRLIYFNIKQIVGFKLLLLLIAILLLPIAFAQLSIASYIYYFEGIIPLVLQVLFINTLIPEIKGQMLFERLSVMSDFKLYLIRYISSLVLAFGIIAVVLIEYGILFFRTIDVNGYNESSTAVYSQIGIVNVFVASMISVLILSTLQVTFTVITKNKTSSLFLTIIFAVINMVLIGFPLNYLSMFFKGDNWLSTKMIWLTIIIVLNGMIFLKNKLTGYIIQTGET